MTVSPSTFAALGYYYWLIGGNIGQNPAGFCIFDQRSQRNPDNQIRRAFSSAPSGSTVFPILGNKTALISEIQQGGQVGICLEYNTAAPAAVSTVRPAGRYILFPMERYGAITAVTTDTAALNRLRAQLLGAALAALDGVDVTQIQIPLGSLLDFDLLWGLGPTVKVHAMTVGTAAGEFSSEFSSAGVNQTLHRISLELEIPLTLMLPGGRAEAVCRTDVPIAETVIVGRVPDTYLQLN